MAAGEIRRAWSVPQSNLGYDSEATPANQPESQPLTVKGVEEVKGKMRLRLQTATGEISVHYKEIIPAGDRSLSKTIKNKLDSILYKKVTIKDDNGKEREVLLNIASLKKHLCLTDGILVAPTKRACSSM